MKLRAHNYQLLGTGGVGSYGNMVSQTGNDMLGPPQPSGHDQYFTLYNKCFVAASKIVVRFVNTHATAAQINFVFPTRDVYMTANDITTAGVMRLAFYKWKINAAAHGNDKTTIKHYMSTAQLTGNKMCSTEESYAGTLAAQAGIIWNWYFGFLDAGDVTNQATGYVDWEITYYCKFYDRNNVAVS